MAGEDGSVLAMHGIRLPWEYLITRKMVGDSVGVTITTAMKLQPRLFYEYSQAGTEATVDLMTGQMTQTTPMAVTFNKLGADDCSKR